MYNYIFATVYNWATNKNKSPWLSKQHACNVVSIALIIHLALILEILKTFFKINFTLISSASKNATTIFVVLFFMMIQFFFTNASIEKIKAKYINAGKLTSKSGWAVAALIFIPLGIIAAIG